MWDKLSQTGDKLSGKQDKWPRMWDRLFQTCYMLSCTWNVRLLFLNVERIDTDLEQDVANLGQVVLAVLS